MSDVLKAAKRLAKQGFSVIWLRERSKAPVGRNWSKKPTKSAVELEDSYLDGYNVGVRLGKPSQIGDFYLSVIDVDIRDPEYRQETIQQVEKLLGLRVNEFPTVISGSANGSFHLYALTESPHASRKLWHSAETFKDEEGKKHWCAEVEFFGTGKQVAMPPSIHPNTGRAYRWKDPFDADELPILDEDRLSALLGDDGDDDYTEEDIQPLGLTFTEGRDILDKLQNWADDRETWAITGMALKHEFGERDGWRMFDKWSQQGKGYDKTENLAQWRSFGRTVKGRPVTMRSLMKEVKDRDISETLDDDTDDLRDMFEDLPKREKKDRVPPHLLTIPGKLGLAVDYYNRNSIVYHPELAVTTAIALGSVVLGRHWSTFGGNFSSLYIMNVADTSTGKEYGTGMIERFLEEAGWDEDVVGRGRWTSDAALFGDLFARPRMIAMSDEVGMYWEAAGKSGSALQGELHTYMNEIWSKGDGKLREKAYSQRGLTEEQKKVQDKRWIKTPSLTIFGATTPGALYEALSYNMIVNGFLNRWLIVNSDREAGPKRLVDRPRHPKAPAAIVNWIERYIYPVDWDDMADFDRSILRNPVAEPRVRHIKYTPKAEAEMRRLELMVIDDQKRLKPFGFAEFYGRVHQMIIKLSMIVAASCESNVVKYEHVKWAGDFVMFHMGHTTKQLVKNMDRLPIDNVVDKLAEKVMESGADGLPVGKAFHSVFGARKLTPYQRNEEIPDRLRLNHQIVQFDHQPKGARQKSKRFIHMKHLRAQRKTNETGRKARNEQRRKGDDVRD